MAKVVGKNDPERFPAAFFDMAGSNECLIVLEKWRTCKYVTIKLLRSQGISSFFFLSHFSSFFLLSFLEGKTICITGKPPLTGPVMNAFQQTARLVLKFGVISSSLCDRVYSGLQQHDFSVLDEIYLKCKSSGSFYSL